jgi:hypothetical protein
VTFNGDFLNKTLVFFGKLSPKRQGNILFLNVFCKMPKFHHKKNSLPTICDHETRILECAKSNVICSSVAHGPSVKSNFFSSFGFVDFLLNCQQERLLKIQYGLLKNLRSRNFTKLPPYGPLLIEIFPSIPKAWPNIPNFFSFHSIEFSMTKWFNIK